MARGDRAHVVFGPVRDDAYRLRRMCRLEREEVIRQRRALTKLTGAARRHRGNECHGAHGDQNDQFSKLHVFS